MKYHMTIMSTETDPAESNSDHFIYHRFIEASSPDEARRIVTKEFTDNKLPVYWIKFN